MLILRPIGSGTMIKSVLAAAGLAVAGVLAVVNDGALAQGPAERPVSFTSTQADEGRSAYLAACVDCHGANLDDGEFGGAPLKGLHFETRWGSDSADVLFRYLSEFMPPDRPGRLNARTYANIMAFMLRANGYQPGAQELPADADALEKFTLKK